MSFRERFPTYGHAFLLTLLLLISIGVVISEIGIIQRLFFLEAIFFLVVPGYSFVVILFPRSRLLEVVFLSVGLSLGLFLGLDLGMNAFLPRGSPLSQSGISRLILAFITTVIIASISVSRIINRRF